MRKSLTRSHPATRAVVSRPVPSFAIGNRTTARLLEAALSSPGQPLDGATRTLMEARFGWDFGAVRIHDGKQAAIAASRLGANALTVGREVVFGAGGLQSSEAGRKLLAHELTHVVQQQAGVGVAEEVGQAGGAHEQHAEAVAQRVVSGGSAGTSLLAAAAGGGTPCVQLQAKSSTVQLPENREFGFRPVHPAVVGAGAAGEHVRVLQMTLLQLGYRLPRFGADGIFGDETKAAVRTFQRDHGLAVDGVAGPKTLAAISELSYTWNPTPADSGPTGLSAVPTYATATLVDPRVALQNEKDYWRSRHKDAILSPFGQSGGDSTGFDFSKEKSWQAVKREETPSEAPKLAPFKSQQTNDLSTFYVNESITPETFVNMMLGRFVHGVGPENFVFPRNGKVSLEMRDAAIVQAALRRWYQANYVAILSGQPLRPTPDSERFQDFGVDAQVSLWWEKLGILNVPQFVGSASVVIEPQVDVAPEGGNFLYAGKDELLVTVRNITSATSGDFLKHFSVFGEAPSFPKDTAHPTTQQFTNISQTFQFTLPINRAQAHFLEEKRKYSEETR